jgi:hypothetical protein
MPSRAMSRCADGAIRADDKDPGDRTAFGLLSDNGRGASTSKGSVSRVDELVRDRLARGLAATATPRLGKPDDRSAKCAAALG